MDRSAGDIATSSPTTIGPNALAAAALNLMNEREITVLAVVDETGTLQGVLHLHDCLRAGVA